jgi:hypothetical protein
MNATGFDALDRLSEPGLFAKIESLARGEHEKLAGLIAHLSELEARRAFLGRGYSSLFTYCRDALHYSDDAAYSRVEAAKAAAKFPVILERLASRDISLTAVRLLRNHLTAENHIQVLDAARHKSTFEVRELVARLAPRAAVPTSIRKLQPCPSVQQSTNVPPARPLFDVVNTGRGCRRRRPNSAEHLCST